MQHGGEAVWHAESGCSSAALAIAFANLVAAVWRELNVFFLDCQGPSCHIATHVLIKSQRKLS